MSVERTSIMKKFFEEREKNGLWPEKGALRIQQPPLNRFDREVAELSDVLS